MIKKYILVSKDPIKGDFTLYESDSYLFIYKKYKMWCNILPTTDFAIYSKIEVNRHDNYC